MLKQALYLCLQGTGGHRALALLGGMDDAIESSFLLHQQQKKNHVMEQAEAGAALAGQFAHAALILLLEDVILLI